MDLVDKTQRLNWFGLECISPRLKAGQALFSEKLEVGSILDILEVFISKKLGLEEGLNDILIGLRSSGLDPQSLSSDRAQKNWLTPLLVC